MERRVKILDRYGNEIEDEDAICPDGGRIHVEVKFADGEENKPPTDERLTPEILRQLDAFRVRMIDERNRGFRNSIERQVRAFRDRLISADENAAPSAAAEAPVLDNQAAPDPREVAWLRMCDRLNNPKVSLSAHHPRGVTVSDAIMRAREALQPPIDTARLTPSQAAHLLYTKRLEQAYRNNHR